MSLSGFFAVGGVAAGPRLRWWLGAPLNPIFPTLSLGTFGANLLGGWLMGLAMGCLSHCESLPAAIRLLLTKGFLGGLTTISAFSVETAALISHEQCAWTAVIVAVRAIGSELMTLVDMTMICMVLKR